MVVWTDNYLCSVFGWPNWSQFSQINGKLLNHDEDEYYNDVDELIMKCKDEFIDEGRCFSNLPHQSVDRRNPLPVRTVSGAQFGVGGVHLSKNASRRQYRGRLTPGNLGVCVIYAHKVNLHLFLSCPLRKRNTVAVQGLDEVFWTAVHI